MFNAALKKAGDKEARRMRKLKELNARGKKKFQRTAEDFDTVKKVLDMRDPGYQARQKKHLKSRLARAVMKDDTKKATSLEMANKKLRSKLLLYGKTGSSGTSRLARDSDATC